MRQYARDRCAARPVLDEDQDPVAAPDGFAQTRRAMRLRKAAREHVTFIHFTEGTRHIDTHQIRVRHFDRRDPLVTGIWEGELHLRLFSPEICCYPVGSSRLCLKLQHFLDAGWQES